MPDFQSYGRNVDITSENAATTSRQPEHAPLLLPPADLLDVEEEREDLESVHSFDSSSTFDATPKGFYASRNA